MKLEKHQYLLQIYNSINFTNKYCKNLLPPFLARMKSHHNKRVVKL